MQPPCWSGWDAFQNLSVGFEMLEPLQTMQKNNDRTRKRSES